MKKVFFVCAAAISALPLLAGSLFEKDFQSWAPTPPMGWNSWDCYGPTVVESEVKANADYMATHLKDYGWEYVVVDIRWFVENDKAGGYNQTNPIYVYDEWGRYTPALNRFPSAADGQGFKPLADYVHDKGLKFGIHIMRGIPKVAVNKKLPVKGADGITADMIANNDSTCTWLRDNMKVDWRKPGAQEYYNSIFDLYAQWGVDFIKIDDLSRPYHTAEIEMIRNAIDQCGRKIVLSISPGETPLEKVEHVRNHANMWRTVDDFWDNWSQLNYQFQVCAKWAPYIAPGTWPDADMLPLGKISIRGERGAERFTNFTADEQKTMMNLWTIFKSPLMFGGDLPQNDDATNALLTNRDVLYMHSHSVANKQVVNLNNHITWSAIDPRNGDRFVALFNTGGSEYIATKDALWRSGTISYLTTGYQTSVDVALPKGSRQLVLIATDGGDGYDCDHADWINPVVTLSDGSKIDLTTKKILRNTCGWGATHVNSNIEGGKLKIDGVEYEKGFATHANSVLIFDLPENAESFSAIAGIDNTGSDQGSKSSVEFFVFNYDPTYRDEWTDQWTGGNIEVKIDPTKQAVTSGYMCRESDNAATEILADIKGAEKLYLVVTNGGDGLSYDHANWANPILVRENGEEVSLTTINWDANPINGWNQPRKNTNNDGNQMSIGGVKYDKGFGVNAPSVLTFTLPEGHDYVSFKATVGLDNDVDNAPSGATVEFRVFTNDPTPNFDANVKLDLTRLGFDEGAKAAISDVWTGESVGEYSDDNYSPFLREHASALYRVSPLGREASAAVSLSKVDCENGFDLEVAVTGAGEGESYVQLVCNDAIIAALPLDENGKASCHFNNDGSACVFKAYYSGTLSIAPAESATLSVAGAGVGEVAANISGIEILPRHDSVVISSDKELFLPIYAIDGTIAKVVRLTHGALLVNLAKGVYIAAGQKFIVG